jgi:hypothetical protein
MINFKSSDQFCLPYFSYPRRTKFKDIRNWTAVEKRSIVIFLINEKNIWEVAFQGEVEFKIKLAQENFNVNRYEVIHFQGRRLIFKENDLKSRWCCMIV